MEVHSLPQHYHNPQHTHSSQLLHDHNNTKSNNYTGQIIINRTEDIYGHQEQHHHQFATTPINNELSKAIISPNGYKTEPHFGYVHAENRVLKAVNEFEVKNECFENSELLISPSTIIVKSESKSNDDVSVFYEKIAPSTNFQQQYSQQQKQQQQQQHPYANFNAPNFFTTEIPASRTASSSAASCTSKDSGTSDAFLMSAQIPSIAPFTSTHAYVDHPTTSSGSPSSSSASVFTTDRKRPYPCTLCPSKFGSKMELEEHQNSHTGMKPFQCDVCQSRFNRRSTLWNHKRIHSDAKPFVCNVCKMTFKWKNSLKCHKEMHYRKKETSSIQDNDGLTYATAKKQQKPTYSNSGQLSRTSSFNVGIIDLNEDVAANQKQQRSVSTSHVSFSQEHIFALKKTSMPAKNTYSTIKDKHAAEVTATCMAFEREDASSAISSACSSDRSIEKNDEYSTAEFGNLEETVIKQPNIFSQRYDMHNSHQMKSFPKMPIPLSGNNNNNKNISNKNNNNCNNSDFNTKETNELNYKLDSAYNQGYDTQFFNCNSMEIQSQHHLQTILPYDEAHSGVIFNEYPILNPVFLSAAAAAIDPFAYTLHEPTVYGNAAPHAVSMIHGMANISSTIENHQNNHLHTIVSENNYLNYP